MHRHKLHILSVLARVIASTAIVPAFIVAGLLSFPTTCQCGADYPHDHSIFDMPGHHHGNQPAAAGWPHTEFNHAGTDGVTVQTPAGANTPPLAAVQATLSHLHSVPQDSTPIDTVVIPDGLRTTPDVPPPQA